MVSIWIFFFSQAYSQSYWNNLCYGFFLYFVFVCVCMCIYLVKVIYTNSRMIKSHWQSILYGFFALATQEKKKHFLIFVAPFDLYHNICLFCIYRKYPSSSNISAIQQMNMCNGDISIWFGFVDRWREFKKKSHSG